MTKEIVEVIEVLEKGKVRIRFNRPQACAGCHTQFFSNLKEQEYILDSKGFDLKKGDRAEVIVAERTVLLATVILLLMPVILFSIILLFFRHKNEVTSFSLAFSGVAVYYLVLKIYFRQQLKCFNLKVVRKVT